MKRYAINLSLLLIAFSCKESPPEPPQLKDPRTYTWTADTLAYPNSVQTIMTGIWGSSPTDVYIVGHNDQPGPGTMFHYDGARWATTHFHAAEGGSISGPVSLSAIYGFGANDVFAVGARFVQHIGSTELSDTSLAIHFDGSQWRDISPVSGKYLNEVWGRSAHDLWVGGAKSTFFRYSGGVWTKDSLPIGVPPNASLQLTSIIGDASSTFAFGLTTQSNPARFTYSFSSHMGETWALVDTFVIDQVSSIDKWGSAGWVSPGGRLYSYSPGVFLWQGNQWVRFFSNSFAFRGMTGTSDQNVFLVGDFGKVYHYNGSDWFQFQNLFDENIVYTGVWFDGREAFVVGYTSAGFPNKTVVQHGR